MEDNKLEEYHYVKIKDKGTEKVYEVVYHSFESLNLAMDTLFESEGSFEVFYDLDEDVLSLNQFLLILNKNPEVADLENPENCKTIAEYKEWLDDFIDFLDIKEFLDS